MNAILDLDRKAAAHTPSARFRHGTGLRAALEAWALNLFELYLAHPWLTERPWSAASQGPNEQDWLEKLLRILGPAAPAQVVTMLFATVRACAQTAAAYRTVDATAWQQQAEATRTHIPDLAQRYPRSSALRPLTPDWRENPRAAVIGAVDLLAAAQLRLCSRSHCSPRRAEARESQASCTTSASSCRLNCPMWLARSSTERWPLKCGVVKNGEASAWTIACFSASEATQKTITSW